MSAATAIAPHALPGAPKPSAQGHAPTGADQGAGDVFAVLAGLAGEDKSVQAATPAPKRAPLKETAAKDQEPAAEAAEIKPEEIADEVAAAVRAPAADPAQPAVFAAPVVAPPVIAQAPAALAPAPANDFVPTSSPPPPPRADEPLLQAGLAGDQGEAVTAAKLPANDPEPVNVAAVAPDTSGRSSEAAKADAPVRPLQTPAPSAQSPTPVPVQAVAVEAPAPAPVASPPEMQPATESEAPPSVAAVVAGAAGAASVQGLAPKPTVQGKANVGDSRGRSADAAVSGEPSNPLAAASAPAGQTVDALLGEAAAEGEADFAAMAGDDAALTADPEGAPAPTATPAPALSASAAAQTPAPAAPVMAGTVTHLAAQILQRLEGRATRFDIQLDPLGLGKVNVSVHIDARGRLSAAMTFDNPDSAEALRARSGDLRQALEQAGFDLSGAGLSFDADLGSSLAREGWGEREGSSAQGRGRAFGAAAETVEQADTATTASGAARGLDIRI